MQVTAANADSTVGASLTVEALREVGHVLVRMSGTGDAIVDKVLVQASVERNIVLRPPSFLGVARIVVETELLAIVPYRFGAAMLGSEDGCLLPVSVDLPGFKVKQHWHERCHADASNRWLRQTVAKLFIRCIVSTDDWRQR